MSELKKEISDYLYEFSEAGQPHSCDQAASIIIERCMFAFNKIDFDNLNDELSFLRRSIGELKEATGDAEKAFSDINKRLNFKD